MAATLMAYALVSSVMVIPVIIIVFAITADIIVWRHQRQKTTTPTTTMSVSAAPTHTSS